MARRTREERFWAKVSKDGPMHPHTPELGNCWDWIAYIQKNGYGQFNSDGKKLIYSHRAAFEIQVGPIDEGMNVLHSCDRRRCVRGSHIRQGTQGDNIRDAVARGRHFTPWRK